MWTHGTLCLSHTAATMGKADYTNGVTNLVINWDDADGEYCAGQVPPKYINIYPS